MLNVKQFEWHLGVGGQAGNAIQSNDQFLKINENHMYCETDKNHMKILFERQHLKFDWMERDTAFSDENLRTMSVSS